MEYVDYRRLERIDKISRTHLPALWQAITAAYHAKLNGKTEAAEAALRRADKILEHLDSSIDYVEYAKVCLAMERGLL